jgi:Ca2+-binding EF-hand superfamily protein
MSQVLFFWNLIARQLSRYLDVNSSIIPLQQSHDPIDDTHQIALSSTQEIQIRDMFNLFDTDGGGTIDKKELDFAMDALGFQTVKLESSMSGPIITSRIKKGATLTGSNAGLVSIMADGTMTLEEFSTVMMGKITGRSPAEDVRAVYSVLSKSDGVPAHDGLITQSKLHNICQDFKVFLGPFPLPYPPQVSPRIPPLQGP